MSHEAAKGQIASHPIRLAFRMLLGAVLGFIVGVATHAAGDISYLWVRAAPFLDAIVGSTLGLGVELYSRLEDVRTKRECLLAGFVCALFAMLWLALIR
jgi:hypothetical protein